MVRIARAAAPMLPGCDVRASTNRMVCGAGGMDAVDWFIAQGYQHGFVVVLRCLARYVSSRLFPDRVLGRGDKHAAPPLLKSAGAAQCGAFFFKRWNRSPWPDPPLPSPSVPHAPRAA